MGLTLLYCVDSSFEWVWVRPKFQVCDLIPKVQLLFLKFGVDDFYSCIIIKVDDVSRYVCVIILCS